MNGVGTLPAWYTLGGLRAEFSPKGRALPYVLGGLGAARLKPNEDFMYTFGGGVQVPVARHWAGDIGYRYSHIAADTALSAGAIHTNAITFGFGYRF